MTVTVTYDLDAALNAGRVIAGTTGLPGRFTVRKDDGRGPSVEIDVVVEGGLCVCTALRLERRDGGPSLSGAALKAVRVADLIEIAARQAALSVGETKDGTPDWERAWEDAGAPRTAEGTRQMRRDLASATARGPRVLTDEHLAEVARIYNAAKDPRKPTRAIMNAFEIPNKTATNWVRAARDRGFLPPREGVPSGQHQ